MLSKPLYLVHLSDLHFGRTSENVLADLKTFLDLKKEEIHLTILTGDLTQRARSHEFQAAKEYISSIPTPLFLVPGNHDVPLYNLFLRFFTPYKKFLKYIGPFAEHYYEDDVLAVFGLWTPNHFSVKSGRIRTRDQIEAEKKFGALAENKIKIFAAHHPLLSFSQPKINSDLQNLVSLKPHLFLWGHEHQSRVLELIPGQFPLCVASGTSTSNRTRIEANSFNYIKIDNHEVHISIYHHGDQGFSVQEEKSYPVKL